MTASHECDIAIIGAGPVGLFAVFQCGMLGMRCHVIDALDMTGGQCAALYPEKPIYDIPAWPKITGQALIDRLAEQAAPFRPVYHLGQQVTALGGEAGALRMTTSTGAVIAAKAVMIAGGAGSFGPNRPPLKGIEGYEGTSVFYYVRKRDDFAGKKIVIAGGGDSAVDWALSLVDVAASVAFVHRRDEFRAAPDSVNKLRALAAAGKIDMVIPYQLAGLDGDGKKLRKVIVKTMAGETRELNADALLPFYGLATTLGPIASWGLDLHKHQIAVDPATLQTNKNGVFCIGDMAHYPGKLKLILQGFSEAAMAAHAAFAVVNPGKLLDTAHSTDKGVPPLK
jgi:thioredoxin reductase (NADPH)